jgi:hypothetical protein
MTSDQEEPASSRLIPGDGRMPDAARRRPAPVRQWDTIIVEDRMIEAMRVLNQMPMATRPRGHANSMPRYQHNATDIRGQREFLDLNQYARFAQIEREERSRNRTRMMPTAAEITRSEQALAWPMMYLRDKPEVARAVCLGALWALRDTDVRKACAKLKIPRRTFYRRKNHGLTIIAIALARAKIPLA